MHSKSSLAALAALSTIAAASPIAQSLDVLRSKYSVKQVDTGRTVRRHGPSAYAKSLKKFGMGEKATQVLVAADATQSGSVTASNQPDDSSYLSPVEIGGQTLYLDFDTGSSDLWVFSNELPSSDVNGQVTYDTSSGSEESGESWQIGYGDGSGASGNVFADTVVIGGVTATSQAVEAATSVSSEFSSNSATDGLVGFAFDSINTCQPSQCTTWFSSVAPSLPADLFAVALKYQAPGTYDFGFIDPSQYSGDITYTPVDSSQGFWSFNADGYSVSGSETDGSLTGIADTGTSLILVSDDIVSAYYAQVDGATNNGGYSFSCDATLPDFGLIVGGTTFTVPGAYINYAANGDGTCYGGIQSSSGIGFNIFGDVFLKAVYTVFDHGNTQIGFAAQS